MIERWRVKALFLTGLLCLALFRPVFSQEMTVEELTAGMSQKWSNIQDLQGDMTVGMQMFGKMMEIKGAIWQKDKLFRAEMTLPPELMPPTDKPVESSKILMVFDGKTMWQFMPMMSMVTKINISALEGTMKNAPFSRSFHSLPDVSYRLSEKKRKGQDYYFLETKEADKFVQNSPVAGMGVNLPMNMSFQSVGVWVNKNTLFPDLIEFYVQKNTPGMYVEFRNVKYDQGLAPELFTFQAPEGVQVMDMTASMKAIAGKMTQTAAEPNTTQAPQ